MASGASLTLAFSPFYAWPVALVALALGVRQLAKLPGNGFKAGWLFGLGWFGAGISWVHVSIADFGGLPLIASVALMALLCGYLALYPALAFYLTKRFFAARLWPLALPACWMLSEWLRSWVLTGFPWLSIGYSQLDSPLQGWFPILGETGVSALLVALAALLAVSSDRASWLRASLAIAIAYVSGWVAGQHNWVTPHKTYQVAMVQGNIKQSLRWIPEQDAPTMKKYRTLTEGLWDSDLIIWPEAAIPKMEYLALDYLAEVDARAAQENTALITGIVNYNWESEEVWNSLLVLGKADSSDESGHYQYSHNNRYAKHHLLPVGEFVPFEDLLRPLAPLFDLPMSSFSRGDFQQRNLLANGIRLAPAICFEIAFPRQVMANVHHNTDMIITVSNDAWFGRSHGPAQHLQIARARAAEMGRPLVRATNNGITAFVDHRGQTISQLAQFEAGSITAPITTTRGMTPYHYFGDFLPGGLTLLLLGLAVARQRRSQH
ncbi:apolipoprotein N-acyltransferase [Alteromonas sp. ASW11-19]|uniref:Apolipoprotein N-acyltransferase n=1 Tax=Alteromonas salexigens TaxID=2982530 RepID=A0ABT2VMW6_9ALTE|nr:apolipoprotein N-acyltransferase [Alteromonas salexigens]MCU7553813.1 apolipoprotein N-acyltransferase [Alteromonas salexigens]